MGSKSRIKKNIIPILQEIIDEHNITTYVEPFVGGCNIIDSIICNQRIANDRSTPLIELFKGLLNGKELPLEINKEHYSDVRKHKDDDTYEEWYKGMVGYLSSYNGKYFGGYAGKVITKTGKVRDYYDEAKRNVQAQVPFLKDIEFFNMDYRKLKIPIGSLIYCDIPYKNTTQYFTSKDFNHEEFWQWVRDMSKNNIVIVSELQAPDDFAVVWEQEVTRTQNNRKREKSIEKMFIYKDCEGYYFRKGEV